jgi:hypothetical protein
VYPVKKLLDRTHTTRRLLKGKVKMTFDVIQLERSGKITWEQLAELEPRLKGLLRGVEASRPTEEKDDFWYEAEWNRLKRPIPNLVGFHRPNGHPDLRTIEAYDVVYFKLLNILYDD